MNMLLVIDVGNTNMEFGLFDRETLAGSFRLRTAPGITSDEIGILSSEYFSRFGYTADDVDDVIISSVVPQIMYSLTSAVLKYFGRQPIIVGTDVDPGLAYAPELGENCEHLGSDRAVAAVAAIAKYGAPLLVIDFGTATTVDAIDGRGCYLGGTIGTGLQVSLDALIRGTAMLPRIELDMPEHVIGTSTVEQLQAGVVAGYVGNIEYQIDRMKKEMGLDEIRVVATGGLSRLIACGTKEISTVDSQLTLDGLRIIYERMKEK